MSSQIITPADRASPQRSSASASDGQSTGALNQNFSGKILLLCVAIAACYSGFAYLFASRILRTEHYQFAPVLVVAIAVLFQSRLQHTSPAPKHRFRWQPLSVGLALCLLLPALYFRSPWIGVVSLLFLIDGLLPAFRQSRNAVRLFWVLVPLPLGYDRSLVLKLQQLASKLASIVLDYWHIPHSMSGNVLELPGQRLLVEEACSGLGSIYLLLSVSLLVVVATKMRFLKAVPLVLSSVVWAILGNVFRIAAIAVAHHRYQIDFASGWNHELLGISSLLLSVLGIACTAGFLNLLLSPVSAKLDSDTKINRFVTPELLWNWSFTTDPGFAKSSSDPGLHIKSRSTMLIPLTAFMLLGAGAYWSPWNLQSLIALRTIAESPLPDISDRSLKRLSSFPAEDVDFFTTLVEINEVILDRRSWKVTSDGREGRLVIQWHHEDYPQLLTPDLLDGWKLLHILRKASPQMDVADSMLVATLVRDLEYRLVAFCCFRTHGEAMKAPSDNHFGRILTPDELSTIKGFQGDLTEEFFSLRYSFDLSSLPTRFDCDRHFTSLQLLYTTAQQHWKAIDAPPVVKEALP